MINIDCPYNKLELLVALASLEPASTKDVDVEALKELTGSLAKMQDATATTIAEYHGVTVEQLLSSQNYELLKRDFVKGRVDKQIQAIRACGYTDKQAWAVIYQLNGGEF